MTVVTGSAFDNTPMPFTPMPHMQEHLDELTAQGRAPKYVKAKRVCLTHLANFLFAEGLMHPAEITRTHLIRFQASVNSNAEWKPSYQQQVLKNVRTFISWCVALGYIPTDPWVRIKIGHTPKKPKPLEDEDLRLLFAAHRQGAFTMSPFTYHRREMVLCLLYGWGLRIHELESLNVTNMDVNLDYVTCRNKGGGTKSMPYTEEMKRIFSRWVVNRQRHAVPGEDGLIIASNGRRMPTHHIAKIIYDLGDRAGVQVNPHRLRDTCGTNLLDADVPVERVMKILGHSNIRQTLAYSRVNDRKVKESMDSAMDPILHDLFSTTSRLRPKDEDDQHS